MKIKFDAQPVISFRPVVPYLGFYNGDLVLVAHERITILSGNIGLGPGDYWTLPNDVVLNNVRPLAPGQKVIIWNENN